jgi:hypothetical protein
MRHFFGAMKDATCMAKTSLPFHDNQRAENHLISAYMYPALSCSLISQATNDCNALKIRVLLLVKVKV